MLYLCLVYMWLVTECVGELVSVRGRTGYGFASYCDVF